MAPFLNPVRCFSRLFSSLDIMRINRDVDYYNKLISSVDELVLNQLDDYFRFLNASGGKELPF